MSRKIVVALLLSCAWLGTWLGIGLGGTALARSGACPSSSMNATQYSEGRHTASGQRFRPDGLTAAHKRLAFGTKLRVTNPGTGASAVVVINDRGPFTRGRDIDLSRGAARAIGLRNIGRICAEVL